MNVRIFAPIASCSLLLAAAVIVGGAARLLPHEPSQLVAPGAVVIDHAPVEVHALAAGTLVEVRVRNGDRVTSGDVLMRLDGEAAAAAASGLARIKDELLVRQARLRAEQNQAADLAFPGELQLRSGDPLLGVLLASERSLFDARRGIQKAQRRELLDRVSRLEKEIDAYKVQAAAKGSELALVNAQLIGARGLRGKGLMSSTTLISLEREAIRLESERDGVLGASIAQAEGRIAETRFLMIQVERDGTAEIMRELRDTESKLAEVSEQSRSADEQLRRLEIRAPEAGVVALSADRSVGSPVSVGEEMVSIAPAVDAFVVDVSIASADVAALRLGQAATVQLPLGEGREHAQLAGTLSQIAPVAREGGAQPSYRARIALAPIDCSRVGPVQPGTEARVMLESNRRSILSAVLAPVSQGLARALKAI